MSIFDHNIDNTVLNITIEQFVKDALGLSMRDVKYNEHKNSLMIVRQFMPPFICAIPPSLYGIIDEIYIDQSGILNSRIYQYLPHTITLSKSSSLSIGQHPDDVGKDVIITDRDFRIGPFANLYVNTVGVGFERCTFGSLENNVGVQFFINVDNFVKSKDCKIDNISKVDIENNGEHIDIQILKSMLAENRLWGFNVEGCQQLNIWSTRGTCGVEYLCIRNSVYKEPTIQQIVRNKLFESCERKSVGDWYIFVPSEQI